MIAAGGGWNLRLNPDVHPMFLDILAEAEDGDICSRGLLSLSGPLIKPVSVSI